MEYRPHPRSRAPPPRNPPALPRACHGLSRPGTGARKGAAARRLSARSAACRILRRLRGSQAAGGRRIEVRLRRARPKDRAAAPLPGRHACPHGRPGHPRCGKAPCPEREELRRMTRGAKPARARLLPEGQEHSQEGHSWSRFCSFLPPLQTPVAQRTHPMNSDVSAVDLVHRDALFFSRPTRCSGQAAGTGAEGTQRKHAAAAARCACLCARKLGPQKQGTLPPGSRRPPGRPDPPCA